MKKTHSPKTTSKPIDFASASTVSDRANIKGIRLINCSCNQTPDTQNGPQIISMECNIKTEVDKKNLLVLVFPTFKLNGSPKLKREEEQQKKSALTISATFLLVYKLSSLDGLEDKNFDAFGRANGIYNAWPYWREFVQNIISRMQLPPLTIPAFHMFGRQKTREVKKN